MQYDIQIIGQTIRNERKKHKWTQNKLGMMLNVSGKQISNYENGKLLPPQDVLLKIADLFNCEYGYILGEESYKDGSKLNTAVCESLGLTSEAVEALRTVTHKGLSQKLEERQKAISCFFESPYFGRFVDCLVEAVTISKGIESYNDGIHQELVSRYGEKLVGKAVVYCSYGDSVPAANANDPMFKKVVNEIDSYIDESQTQEYAQKVARYELREAFEQLIRSIE